MKYGFGQVPDPWLEVIVSACAKPGSMELSHLLTLNFLNVCRTLEQRYSENNTVYAVSSWFRSQALVRMLAYELKNSASIISGGWVVTYWTGADKNFMKIYLIDGTYELFRHFFAVPSASDVNGQEVGAVRGVLNSVLSMIEDGVTHLGVATDHVVESFRNDLYTGYKTSEGVAPELLSQFPVLEEGLQAMGVMIWPMVEFEADDALAAAALKASLDPRVEQVLICTPDKDLAQTVSGSRIVQLDRRRNILRDEAGVMEKFGVSPKSIPDYLGLVGDSADGYPGIAGWGEKAASSVLSQYPHLEDIPKDWKNWASSIKRAPKLSESLFGAFDEALLFRKLATLRTDVPVFENVEDLMWRGPKVEFESYCKKMKSDALLKRVLSAHRT